MRDLLAMNNVTFHGEFVNVTGIELDIVHGRREPRNVPIYIGATGPKMMAMAGEIGDGALLNYLVSPAYNVEALSQLEKGATLAGKTLDDIDRPQLVVCSVDQDRKKALDGARKLVTQYLGQQPHIMKASGVSSDVLDEIHQVLTWPATEEQIERAMELVGRCRAVITASGTPESARQSARICGGGCTARCCIRWGRRPVDDRYLRRRVLRLSAARRERPMCDLAAAQREVVLCMRCRKSVRAQIRFFNDGPSAARVTLGDEYQSYPGVAHGGILATILDETMGRAVLADDGPERFMFTARMETRFRRPVPLHQEFVVRGQVDSIRDRTALVSGQIALTDGTVAVEASATLVDIPSEQMEAMLAQDVGWQVYP